MARSDLKETGPTKPIPEPTLRRLPIYYQYLKKWHGETHLDYISYNQIGADLNVLPIKVRKDLEIEAFLGWDNTTDGYLVGVGNLGSALLGYQGFRDYGLNIIAAFDTDESKVGKEIHGTVVLPVEKLPNMIKRMGIKIGILTVPAHSAQDLAATMVDAGVRAIWNFSPVKINVPPHVIVQHENLASSLVVLSKKLTQAMKATAE